MSEEHSDKRGEARQSFLAKQQLIDLGRAAFQMLSALLKNSTLYPESHPILLTSAQKLRRTIEELLIGRNEAPFYLVGGELFFEKISIPIDQSLALIMEHFVAKDVGGISFKKGLAVEELIRFSSLMNKDHAFLVSRGGFHDAILKEGIVHMELYRVLMVEKHTGAETKDRKQGVSHHVFKEAIDTVKEMVHTVQIGKLSNVAKINKVVHNMVDSMLENPHALLGLTNMKMFDEYTFAHSVNVSILAVSLGAFLSLEKSQIAALGIAGLMHDIGKMNVDTNIINKPGKPTDEEWEALKRHPVEGALLLAGSPGISKFAMVAAFEHHQHQHGDVRGYPAVDGELRKHPFSQIISLVDAYDAITAARVYYSSQMTPDEGVRILLKKRGAPFNPVLVNAFVKMVGIFPIGTLLKLDTGEIGLVIQQTSDLLRPRVLILTRFDGSEKENGSMVSLLETVKGHYKRSITGTINPSSAKLDVKKYLN